MRATGLRTARPRDGRRGDASDDFGGIRIGNVQLLTAAEEFELVSKLGQLRLGIRRQLKPLLQGAPEGARLDHFDQIVTYYWSLRREGRVNAKVRRTVDGPLSEYSQIKHRLVVSNLPWVTKLARGQKQTAIAEEDLFQEGVCGLLKAIDRFEAERGLRLMTYATWYIREAMQQVRARQSHSVALSAHDQTFLGEVEARRMEFLHTHGRAPTNAELSQQVGRATSFLSRLQGATSPTVSLERHAGDGPIPVVVEDPVHEFDRIEEIGAAVTRLLDALPMRERLVVTRRFGLDGQEPTSLETLGCDLNVSKERVRQLQRQAIKRMQQRVDEEQLEPIAV